MTLGADRRTQFQLVLASASDLVGSNRWIPHRTSYSFLVPLHRRGSLMSSSSRLTVTRVWSTWKNRGSMVIANRIVFSSKITPPVCPYTTIVEGRLSQQKNMQIFLVLVPACRQPVPALSCAGYSTAAGDRCSSRWSAIAGSQGWLQHLHTVVLAFYSTSSSIDTIWRPWSQHLGVPASYMSILA